MKIDLLVSFSVNRKTAPNEHLDVVQSLLVPEEKIELAYAHTRDKVWFTNKRIIALDVQGLTGSKKEFRSFPYTCISSFSIETAGLLDGDCDFKIWVSGVGVFEIKFSRKIDIKEIGEYLSIQLLN